MSKAFRREERSGVRSRGKWQGLPLVVEEGLFRDVVIREQKRADRFDQPFVLVLVSLRAGRSCEAETWLGAIEALTVAKRDTDILGWFTRGSLLGVMVPDIDANDSSVILDLESRVHAAMARRLDAETRADFLVRVYRHAPPTPATSETRQPSDRLLRSLHRSTGAMVRSGLKRALDIAGSGLLLLLLSPIFLLIAVLVKSKSRGPVFFSQSRVGEQGRSFTMLKFRTMRVNNDHAIHKQFVSQMINGSSPTGGDSAKETPFKIVNDPRVTSIGRLLRKTSLDELPQLWNVLRGDMARSTSTLVPIRASRVHRCRPRRTVGQRCVVLSGQELDHWPSPCLAAVFRPL